MKIADYFNSELGAGILIGSITIMLLSCIASLNDVPYTMFIFKSSILFLATYLSIGVIFFRE
ncbi:hypothetical protein LCGC14_1196210 [marine sediment metagenome]|uniref:Uncharacterized protein n=1 Tax=marine sediment metagenome TaxID=412755 RepID=A0A0F9LIF1_9ZZZZ